MKKLILLSSIVLLALTSCGGIAYSCNDPLGCVVVDKGDSIEIGALLTLTTPDAPYGIDALRGVEIALDTKKNIQGFPLEIAKQDDLCSEEGGTNGANAFASDNRIVGVIGATCSSASIPAARILTEAKMVMISPSSTTPSLTETGTHEAGFLRVIYNDKAQGKFVAEFARTVLGMKSMVTIHDGTAYSKQLQEAACDSFEQLGGVCITQIRIESGKENMELLLQRIAVLKPDILYFPIYTADGVALANQIRKSQMTDIALISSDGLLSTDFIHQTSPASQGMYMSGPTNSSESPEFLQKYQDKYGEAPIASYHLQGYDAANMLLNAIEKVAISSRGSLFIPRQALRAALYQTQGMQGLSGVLVCSPSGDCASPDITIFQVQGGDFTPIFP